MRPPSVVIAASLRRSGSSLVQRMIAAALGGIVWGEFPVPVIAPLAALADGFARKEPLSARQRREFFDRGGGDGWHANMMPPPDRVLEAERAFLATLLGGEDRPWGWKAVDHSPADLDHVAILFPTVAQVLIVRDLRAIYPSLVARGWDRWWPGGIDEIATEWADRSLAYIDRAGRGRASLFRYEDLRPRLRELMELVGGDRERASAELDRIVSPTKGGALDPHARERIERIAGPALRAMGYREEGIA